VIIQFNARQLLRNSLGDPTHSAATEKDAKYSPKLTAVVVNIQLTFPVSQPCSA